MSEIRIPGGWIVERGREQLRTYPWATRLRLGWKSETGQRIEFEVNIKAIRCGVQLHPMGAWWEVRDTTLAPIPMCPRCLEDGREEAENTLSDGALAEWRIRRDYAEKMWTDLKGVV